MARKRTVILALALLLSGASMSAQAPTTPPPQAQRVFITGEIDKPGGYALVPGMTLAQLVTSAGGFTAAADRSRVVVISATKTDQLGKPLTLVLDYEALAKGKDVAKNNPELRAGDQVIVRRPR